MSPKSHYFLFFESVYDMEAFLKQNMALLTQKFWKKLLEIQTRKNPEV